MLNGSLDHVVRDSSVDPVVAELPITGDGRIGAYIGVPVVLSDGELYGTFCCVDHEPVPGLRERDVKFLQVLAQLVADQLDEEKRLEELRRLEVAAGNVGALLAALEARDGYTEAHSIAVVELALAVGRRLNLGDAALRDLESAALLHDIGKLGVADAVLRKPGPLTPDEWTEMRRHPEIDQRIVASMPALSHLAPVIRAEHERWDVTFERTGALWTVGRAFTFETLKHASPRSEEQLVEALDEPWQRRIVRERGVDACDFSHDKLRRR